MVNGGCGRFTLRRVQVFLLCCIVFAGIIGAASAAALVMQPKIYVKASPVYVACPAPYECMVPDVALEKGYVSAINLSACGVATVNSVEQTEYCYRPPVKQVSGISAVHRVQPGVIYEKAVVTVVPLENAKPTTAQTGLSRVVAPAVVNAVVPVKTTENDNTVSSFALKGPLTQVKKRDRSIIDSVYSVFAGAAFCQMKSMCDGTCYDLNTDLSNCGGCGNICPPGPAGSVGAAECSGGKCVEHTCPNSQLYCSGQCVDTRSDANNCGACGTICPSCINGQCVYQKDSYSSNHIDLTPQITQQRYFTKPGNKLNIMKPDYTKILVYFGDSSADPSGWYVGTDSTICVDTVGNACITNEWCDWWINNPPANEGYQMDYYTMDYRVKMFVDTNQFNKKPVQKATLKLNVAHTYMPWGETQPQGQTIHDVYYKKTDPFPVSYPEAFDYIDPYVGVYLGNIPTMGAGANWGASPPNYGSPVTGGQAWGGTSSAVSLYSQPKATWDPQTRTLTIDMTELVNQWITGQKPNYGFVLKDGASTGPRSKLLSAYSFESFEVQT